MSTSLSSFQTALVAAKTAYLASLETLFGAMIDLEALSGTVESIGGGKQARFGAYARDEWQNLQTTLEHPVAAPRQKFAAALRTSAATTTSSPTLTFTAVPSWIVVGMPVFDLTNGNAIGTVSAVGATTLTLAANAAHAVASGDVLSFPLTGRLQGKIDDATRVYIGEWSGS